MVPVACILSLTAIFFHSQNLPNCQPGQVVYLQGISPDKGRFAFNLFPGKPYDMASPGQKDIAFHFNPRFDQNTVVRNTRSNSHWGNEERDGGMPFIPYQPFVLAVTWQRSAYEIAVNGVPFAKYGHRHHFRDDAVLLISGLSTIRELKQR